MCNICGIVSEKIRPESAYWGKMCEYVTKGKLITSGGCCASGKGESFFKIFSGHKYFVIVDGKIQNAASLKRSLDLRGTAFETESDAELVLLYYILLGESSFKLFKGEFCIVIWDGAENELIMVRDKIGINTLFYYFDGFRLVFASEIKGIHIFPCVKKNLSDDIYCKLFAIAGGGLFGETLFDRIFEIPPGCYVSCKGLKVRVKSYHTFLVRDAADDLEQTISGIEYLTKNNKEHNLLKEKTISADRLKYNIERFVELSDLPSPYVDLKVISNIDSEEKFADTTGVFNIPARFKLPSVWCRRQDKEFTDGFLSTLPWFEHKGEKDILKKEEIYIKQYIVLPQLVYARRKACPGIFFPYLTEDVAEYSLKSLKYRKRISKCFADQCRYDKSNCKNLRILFFDMISDENAMAGLIDREELLKFSRLFPRPETILYLLQVNVWLNKFL